MSDNSRPTLTLNQRPFMVWNDLPEATSYRFTMTKENQENHWIKEILCDDPKIELMQGENINYLKYPYPDENYPLDYSGTFLLTGEAYDNKQTLLSTSKITVILLEQITQDIVQEFESMLDLDLTNREISDLPELSQRWLKAKEFILVPKSFDGDTWGIVHTLTIFEKGKFN